MKKVIVGAGASGLVCAIESAKRGIETILIESKNRVGKKISLTGNGRCNLLNKDIRREHFAQSKCVDLLLKEYNYENVNDMLKSYGIFTFVDNFERVYPLTENANTVVDCLLQTAQKVGVKIHLDTTVKSITKRENSFKIETTAGVFYADKVVLANGSRAQNDSFLQLIKREWLTEIYPSLVPIKTTQIDKSLNGHRVKCKATLKSNGKVLHVESGEVLFRNYGLSGVCIFNLSAHIARQKVLSNNANFVIELDLLPTFTKEELVEILKKRKNDENPLLGLLTNKLAQNILKTAKGTEQIVNLVKHYSFTVDELLDFSQAQTVCGGVKDEFLSNDFELPSGVQVVGELLNADGICGGYNLFIAFASGCYVASR